jgi:uncharacterized membrane protein
MNAVNPTQRIPDSVPSTAAINGHPIHPMMVGFPIAFFSGALLTDIMYAVRSDLFWAQCSYWLLGAGVVMGLVAALFGIADFFGDERVRNLAVAKLHFAGNALLIGLAAYNVSLRLDDPAAAIVPLGLGLSVAGVAILTVTGWLGGEMAYRHRVGVVPR